MHYVYVCFRFWCAIVVQYSRAMSLSFEWHPKKIICSAHKTPYLTETHTLYNSSSSTNCINILTAMRQLSKFPWNVLAHIRFLCTVFIVIEYFVSDSFEFAFTEALEYIAFVPSVKLWHNRCTHSNILRITWNFPIFKHFEITLFQFYGIIIAINWIFSYDGNHKIQPNALTVVVSMFCCSRIRVLFPWEDNENWMFGGIDLLLGGRHLILRANVFVRCYSFCFARTLRYIRKNVTVYTDSATTTCLCMPH